MRFRHETFQVTCPANTPITAPVEVLTMVSPGEPISCKLEIPRGHSYTTGIQIALAHQQVIPYIGGTWVLGDSTAHEYDLRGLSNSGAWSAIMYNTDPQHDHFFQLHFTTAALQSPPRRRARAMIAPAAIKAAAARL